MSDIANILGKLIELVRENYLVIGGFLIIYILLWVLGKFALASLQNVVSRVLLRRFAGQRIPTPAKMENMLQAVPMPWAEIHREVRSPIISYPGRFWVYINNERSLANYFTPACLVNILERAVEKVSLAQ